MYQILTTIFLWVFLFLDTVFFSNLITTDLKTQITTDG